MADGSATRMKAPQRVQPSIMRGILHRRIDAVEEALHEPGEEADVHGDVRQQQADVGVVDAPALGHEIERQHPGNIGHAAEHIDGAEPGVAMPAR